MELRIDGQKRTLMDIRGFRAEHGLPEEFGVATFEPKNYAGLGSIEAAGETLNIIRTSILSVIPPELHYTQLMPFSDQLKGYFRVRLYMANDEIRLHDEEVDFAVSGFEDVMMTVIYAILHAGNTRTDVPEFDVLYLRWLDDTVRVSRRIHTYTTPSGEQWEVNIINNAYGRLGLVVHTPTATHYLRDSRLACPAEGFMYHLLKEAAARLQAVVTWRNL